MNLDESISLACSVVPGLVDGALVLLPEAILIGGVGAGGAYDREPLVRSASRLLGIHARPTLLASGRSTFVEYAFVSEGQLVVIVRGRRLPRVALVLVCTREPNLALVLSSTRCALGTIETTIDLAEWEL